MRFVQLVVLSAACVAVEVTAMPHSYGPILASDVPADPVPADADATPVAAPAAPAVDDTQRKRNSVRLLNEKNEYPNKNAYSFSFATSDGTSRDESGRLENEALTVHGGYSWISPDGRLYRVVYVADANGYRPIVTVHHIIQSLSGSASIPPTLLASLVGG